jgi:hypothetical protein
VQGHDGLVQSARPGQIVVELGSYPVPVKARQIAKLPEFDLHQSAFKILVL